MGITTAAHFLQLTPLYWCGVYVTCLSLWVSFAAGQCAPYPISIPIRNVSVGNNATRLGLPLSVGTPGNELSFTPQWPYNNTYVYGTNGFCSSDSEIYCSVFRGGQYNETASSSAGIAAEGAYPQDSTLSCNWLTDDLTLNSNVTLNKFPIGLSVQDQGNQGYYPQAGLGLGKDSSLLQTLSTSKQIASRSWGMFGGRECPQESSQMDGSLVLGGYDEAKVAGSNYTQPLSYSGCDTGMLVTISDIVLNLSNNQNTSLFDGSHSTALSACISPHMPMLMSLPLDPYMSTFETITGDGDTYIDFTETTGINYWTLIYSNASQAYDGDLTIAFSNGLSVRIPNSEIVVPNREIQQDGSITANASEPNLLIISLQDVNENDIVKLGRHFLSSAYVMVNLDHQTFTMWEANPTTEENLVAVGTDSAPTMDFCTAQSNNTSSPTPVPSPVQHDHGLSGGAIAGIVVGTVVGVALIAGALLASWKLKSPAPERSQHQVQQYLIPNAPSEVPGSESFSLPPQELSVRDVRSAKPAPPAELP